MQQPKVACNSTSVVSKVVNKRCIGSVNSSRRRPYRMGIYVNLAAIGVQGTCHMTASRPSSLFLSDAFCCGKPIVAEGDLSDLSAVIRSESLAFFDSIVLPMFEATLTATTVFETLKGGWFRGTRGRIIMDIGWVAVRIPAVAQLVLPMTDMTAVGQRDRLTRHAASTRWTHPRFRVTGNAGATSKIATGSRATFLWSCRRNNNWIT